MTHASGDLLVLATAWGGYFLLHSALASRRVRAWLIRRWPGIARWYRVVYNFIALATLALPAALMLTSHGGPLWSWEGPWRWLAWGLDLAVVVGFFYSLRFYDGREFLGLRQLHSSTGADRETFRVSPLHRWVRHPWYSMGLVLLWTQDMDPARLVSGLLITLYLIAGSRLEERKLIALHGAAYEEYRRRVAPLIPLPGRILDQAEAERLESWAAARACTSGNSLTQEAT